MSNLIRALAEQIVDDHFRRLGVENVVSNAFAVERGRDVRDWEGRIQGALPGVAYLLGELAVVRDRLMAASAWIDDRVAPWSYSDADARAFDRDRDYVVELARSALASGSGRLGGGRC